MEPIENLKKIFVPGVQFNDLVHGDCWTVDCNAKFTRYISTDSIYVSTTAGRTACVQKKGRTAIVKPNGKTTSLTKQETLNKKILLLR